MGDGFADPKEMLQLLARKEREPISNVQTSYLTDISLRPLFNSIFSGCVIAMTGKTDWVSDGTTTVSLHNGHELLGNITGSGCIVGTSIAAFCATANSEALSEVKASRSPLLKADMLLGAITG